MMASKLCLKRPSDRCMTRIVWLEALTWTKIANKVSSARVAPVSPVAYLLRRHGFDDSPTVTFTSLCKEGNA